MKNMFLSSIATRVLGVAMSLVFMLGTVSCTSLHSGQSFVAEADGITYRYEVIVSYHNYVRISPVTSAGDVTGALTLPSTVRYEGQTYVVSQVASNAFSNYTGITSLTLPPTISVIEAAAFRNCSSLSSVSVPTSVSTIEDYAFENCTQLQSFQFVTSLSTLGQGCFRGCSSLANIELPSTITAIPADAFSGCTAVTSLQLPTTIMQIGDRAFAHCSGLHSIYLDRSVQQMGDSTFVGCDSVQAITCLTATPPACSSTTFGNMPTTIPVTVMMSAISNYQTATGWNRFTNYVGTY